MPCEYDNEFQCGDSVYDLTKKILGRLKQLVGFGPGGGGGGGGDVTLTVSDIEIGAIEIKDSTTDNRATVRNTDPVATDFGLVVRNIPSGTQVVSGPFLTDTQLRATPVPVSGPLTDAELRAAAVPISVASLPLPAGAATEATLASLASEATALTLLTEAEFEARINTLGQKISDESTPVVLSSEQQTLLQQSVDNTGGILASITFIETAVADAPTFATVGVTSASAVASNINRVSIYLTNTSNNVISLAFAPDAAVLNSGITLFPGDTFMMERPGMCLTQQINAIAGAAASNLSIQQSTA